MIRIMIVDDSETEIALLKSIIQTQSDMEVIACARNGKEAVELAKKLKPNLITMDIHMPIQNGFEAIRIIMMECPTPIVVISSRVNDVNSDTTFLAMEAGALTAIDKPVNSKHPSYPIIANRTIELLRSMAEIKVVRRRPASKKHPKEKFDKIEDASTPAPNTKFCRNNYELIAIGCSVGGPQALKSILEKLPADFPVPIVVVQHMTPGFIENFSKWLNHECKINIKCVSNHEPLLPGTVYLAPDNYHLRVQHMNYQLVANTQKAEPVCGFHPSINVLMHSVARSCGANAVAMLLTGMGNDGSQGLVEVKSKKGHTIIQDSGSCVVFGMAGVAQSLGGVDVVVDLDKIADYLIKITS